ncbi:hypothetical protein [Haloferula sp. BvORR071]|uniref:hypothetical protein n=1 Tax=Haloferula sp. BvORR071 TaxID=1396141 RepID=UPI00054DE39E|nr:hypothetical protein [Haloferula sp. BvORR071]
MGREYKIVCDPQAVASFDGFLRSQPYFDSYDAVNSLYNLRESGIAKEGDWPDGYASIEPNGVYFCDNLTATKSAAWILKSLIDQALTHCDRIVVYEP